MNRYSVVVFAFALLSGELRTGAPQGDQAQFRATVTGVMVPVYVRQGGRPVSGLTADDFVLLDSTVTQAVATIDGSVVPLDVSLVVENSEMAEYMSRRYEDEFADIRALLRPDDRLRMVSAADDVVEVQPLTPVADAPQALGWPAPTTHMAVYDAVGSVLVRSATAGRQHVVIVLTTAFDTVGVTGSEVLFELAQRTLAQAHVLISQPARTGTRRQAKWQPGVADWSIWEPSRRAELRARTTMTERQRREAEERSMHQRLVRVVAATGGSQIRSNLFTGSIAGPVQRVLEEVRASYILYYTPTGVPDTGWHPITVTMKDPAKKYEIRVRPGFMR